MQVFAQAFWIPKAGTIESEYEDAFWPNKPIHDRTTCARFAVADGAQESSFSKIWATQLVRHFCKGQIDASLNLDVLREIQRRWYAIVSRRPLPWYAEEKILSGAFAAIIGLVLEDQESCNDSQGQWHAVAVGDCCLVHMRGEQILARFPLDSSEAFTNRPHLLSSHPDHNNTVTEHFRTAEGGWVQDDSFYLMTDALACWFMREVEQGRTPWRILRDLDTTSGIKPFREWVDELRMNRTIRNDDVTLLRIDLA